jgi:short subunit dehydrogenase-like uncharacterized protein
LSQRILIYGATGYTGRLLAAEAARRGLDVVLAGRHAERLKAVAEEHGLETRVLALSDPARLRAALEDVACLLHAAGPFSQTWEPMVAACLETRTHYLDVTGELDVLEAIARRGDEARARDVTLLPGAGFDVVASDCLAAHIAGRLPEATTLRLALAGMGGRVSRGTAKTLVESLGDGLRIRRDGVLVRRGAGSLERHFDFGAGPARGLAMPLGDLSSAFHSTGIPNIEIYVIVSGGVPRLLRASRLVAPLLRQPFVQRFLKRRIDRMPEGPDEVELTESRISILAEAEAPGHDPVRARLETQGSYAFTALSAIELAKRVANGEAPTGFQTPSSAFGADCVLELPDCTRLDLD